VGEKGGGEMTITVQIGNSDDKLTQKEWSDFVTRMRLLLFAVPMHFHACSEGSMEWQNAVWVFEVEGDYEREWLKEKVKEIRKDFRQDSVAWTEGSTVMI
jgi:hypothetical protein